MGVNVAHTVAGHLERMSLGSRLELPEFQAENAWGLAGGQQGLAGRCLASHGTILRRHDEWLEAMDEKAAGSHEGSFRGKKRHFLPKVAWPSEIREGGKQEISPRSLAAAWQACGGLG